ncbi:hypothetical protein SAMN04489732_10393 [Amycolatopsis saalfeldensis]|uniref:Uncharacterized protein n=1 Tax=Amycolatopsis saalfeldensis TaxID=394193 RepID=A0A1H8U7G0_9PSEU|nr:hypothetical protein SAMN04489732_10393 [Amycolatopsis saalfeldensis]
MPDRAGVRGPFDEVAESPDDLEARLCCPVVHVDPGTVLSRALDDHLAAGFDIESASDGWVLLRKADVRFVLAITAPLAGSSRKT